MASFCALVCVARFCSSSCVIPTEVPETFRWPRSPSVALPSTTCFSPSSCSTTTRCCAACLHAPISQRGMNALPRLSRIVSTRQSGAVYVRLPAAALEANLLCERYSSRKGSDQVCSIYTIGPKVPASTRARWRTPDGASRSQTFALKVDVEQHLASVTVKAAAGDYVDSSPGASRSACRDVVGFLTAAPRLDRRRRRRGAPGAHPADLRAPAARHHPHERSTGVGLRARPRPVDRGDHVQASQEHLRCCRRGPADLPVAVHPQREAATPGRRRSRADAARTGAGDGGRRRRPLPRSRDSAGRLGAAPGRGAGPDRGSSRLPVAPAPCRPPAGDREGEAAHAGTDEVAVERADGPGAAGGARRAGPSRRALRPRPGRSRVHERARRPDPSSSPRLVVAGRGEEGGRRRVHAPRPPALRGVRVDRPRRKRQSRPEASRALVGGNHPQRVRPPVARVGGRHPAALDAGLAAVVSPSCHGEPVAERS